MNRWRWSEKKEKPSHTENRDDRSRREIASLTVLGGTRLEANRVEEKEQMEGKMRRAGQRQSNEEGKSSHIVYYK